jgi:rhodanese-related sulfurtransferase
MKILLHSIAYLFSLALLSACQAQEDKSTLNLSPQDFAQQIKAKGDSVLLVDVRTPGEYRGGHLDGALSLDFYGSDFAGEVAKLPKDKQVFVYCRSGSRSQASVSAFLKAGFKKVTNLEDGIGGWQDAGLPLKAD